MRTKALLLTAAAVAAGIATVSAQVYSANVVGYVNANVPNNQFVMIENPLNLAAGNVISNVLSGTYPDGMQVYRFAGGAFLNPEQYYAGFGWFPGTNVLNPGEGFFLISPSGATTVTFVGEVLQGSQSNVLPAGYSIRGSQVPQSIPLGAAGITDSTNTMAFPAIDGDTIFRWYTNTYSGSIQYYGGYGWFDNNISGGGSTNGFSPNVGEAFFVQNGTTTNRTWVRSFTVQ